MRRPLVPAALAALLLVLAAPAGAITTGTPDNGGHPEVGGLLAATAYADGTWIECSGTLVSPTVLLTAAHCDDGRSRVAVTFDSHYAAKGTALWGTFHANPGYNQSQSDPGDLAVVVLDKPVKGITPARLPAAGSLSGLDGAATFTSVGYGAQAVAMGAGGATFSYADTRFVATGTLDSLTPSWLRVSQNAATGNGGTCYGDSGGPNFLGSGAAETAIVAGVTITGDAVCRSTNVDYRLDTAAARAFLGAYVRLP